jgi:hypothetical protein
MFHNSRHESLGRLKNFLEALVRRPLLGFDFERWSVGNCYPSTFKIDVCVVGISADDARDAFHDFAGVSLHLSSDRKDGVAGTVSEMTYGQEKLI